MSAPVRILLAGYFGAGNLGDEAILGATLVGLGTALGEAFHPTVAAYDRGALRAYHGPVETVDIWDVRALAAAVANSDLVIWGGGGLVQDRWYVPIEDLLLDARGGVPAHLRVPFLAALKGVPCMMYAQGVGPLSHPESRRATALVCNRLAAITVRDPASARLLRDCGVDEPPIVVTADPALATVPAGVSAALSALGAAGLDLVRRPRLIVAPRIALYGDRAWVEPLVAALRATVLDRGGAVAFVAFDHRPEGDEALCRELALRCGGAPAAAAVTAWLSASECAAVLADADAVVATRLHALVLAAAAGTPAVALDYDPKIPALAAQLDGAVPVLPLDSLAAGELARAINETLTAAADRRSRLRAAAAALRAREALNLRIALALVGRGELPAEAVGASEPGAGSRADRIRALEVERDELQRRLDALRGSRVVRLAEAYWRWTAGESGRFGPGRLLGAAHRLVLRRRMAPEPGATCPPATDSLPPTTPPPAAPPPAAPSVVAEVGPPDPWSELAGFEAALGTSAAGVAVVLSTTRLVESEGQRSMQLALALARRGFAVVFAYWRWSPDEWCIQDRLDQGIFQVPLDVFTAAPAGVLGRFSGCPRRIVLVEFPHPSFVEIVALARAQGWATVYDVVDDWAEFHRVGQATWYEEGAERELLARATLVCAVTPGLERRLGALGAPRPLLVPNGVRPEIAEVKSPIALERGEVTIGYFGYLSGAWFDWPLLLAAARSRPSWRFYVVGYGGEPEGEPVPGNLVQLGKQPQTSLAAFAANWDVAIVPFKAETLAAGADPIKTYEYLAMGLPVVVTGVVPPAGAEAFVERVEGLEAFLEALERAARRPTAEAEQRRAWAAGHTWEARLAALLDALPPPGT
ncbi:MAG TPA: polysaccharide pyruvyl transferase family protein [Thermoanaerobaculaceae bacterium]|nr:polysaccharide pyruvyl transferase family protein [Thermoanaerobaculaceae bacterium]HRS16899.1 polysaccharide pyruvyl transferase family protein [Thermoanaerobaculaceae bacterium]